MRVNDDCGKESEKLRAIPTWSARGRAVEVFCAPSTLYAHPRHLHLTSPHLTFSDHRHYEGWAQYCTRESYTLASTLSRMVNALRGTALLLYLALVNLQSSLAAPTPALSTAVAEKKRATLGFSQKPVFSRHGDAFKARHARRDYDTQTRSIERRQADNDAPLYNLEDAR